MWAGGSGWKIPESRLPKGGGLDGYGHRVLRSFAIVRSNERINDSAA